MRYVVFVAFGLAAALAADAACTSFEDAEPRAAAPDAGVDVAPPLPSTDAGDARAPLPFCATDAGTRCEDFDDPKSGVLPFTTGDPGFEFTLDTEHHVSAPNALRLTIARPPVGEPCRYAFRHGTIEAPAANGVRLEYKLRPASLGDYANVGASVVLANTDNSQSCNAYIQHYPDGAKLYVTDNASASRSLPLTRRAPLGEWTAIVIDMTGPPGGRKLAVTFDGVLAGQDTTVADACQNATRLMRLEVFARCVSDQSGADLDVSVDDVRVIAH